jgi:hypothetical protein
VITVTDNTQASPTNGLTVTTFTAPDGAEKTLTFSAEVPRTSVHATGENSRSDTVSSIKSTDIQIPPDPITNTTVLRGSPAKRTYVPTPPTSAGSRQLIPSAPPYQTERYDTTVYVTPTTGLSPTPTPSNASCSPDTKEVEIEILWKIFKLLQENREENLKNPTPCSQNLSHILPDLLHQLRKTQDTI